jgi:hypothetical protein
MIHLIMFLDRRKGIFRRTEPAGSTHDAGLIVIVGRGRVRLRTICGWGHSWSNRFSTPSESPGMVRVGTTIVTMRQNRGYLTYLIMYYTVAACRRYDRNNEYCRQVLNRRSPRPR